jgi:NADPH:quinone reductase-like Zn-dependent oxidoreductase
MKAVTYNQYGSPDVLELSEVDKPQPSEEEVLVRVKASSVNPVEWYGMIGLGVARLQGGWLRPKQTRLGSDFSGVVEEVGAKVTHVQPGDKVYGGRDGAFAEYVCVRNAVAAMPKNVSFEEAAAVPIAGLTALQGLRDYGRLQAGQKVLINGASGGVGTFAVQIAKALGAEVTGVCSTRNVEQTRSLGADHVVDYSKEDFSQRGEQYDLFFDIAGGRTWRSCRRVLKKEATFLIVGAPKGGKLLGPLRYMIPLRLGAMGASQTVKLFIAQFNREDLDGLREMIEAGKVKPVVERSYSLADISAAMAYLGEGHARAKVAITMPG